MSRDTTANSRRSWRKKGHNALGIVKTLSTKKHLLPSINRILGFSIAGFGFELAPFMNPVLERALRGEYVVAKRLVDLAYPLIGRAVCAALQGPDRTRNYIVAPLLVAGDVVGGIVITSVRDQVAREELRLIEVSSRAAAHAIGNADLRAQTVRAEQRLLESLREKEVLLKEIHHRVKWMALVHEKLYQAEHLFGSYRVEDGVVKMVVGDTGVGMPEGVQVESAQTLGLRLVKSLTGQLQGRVEYSGDNGAEFAIRFAPATEETIP